MPKIGFACLGCPKALVDSERILTPLRVEGAIANAPPDPVPGISAQRLKSRIGKNRTGEFAKVRIDRADAHDLYGRLQ